MHYFSYKESHLYCEEASVLSLASKFKTPLYVYSAKTIIDHFTKIKKAFCRFKPLICYSVKANSNLSILNMLVKRGAGLDIVSGGELFRAKRVACPAKKIVYASVGKSESEIADAIKYGILMFNVESVAEIKRINDIAKSLRKRKRVNVSLRVNPDIDPKTHSYITTSKKENKFGLNFKSALNVFLASGDYPYLNISGIHLHIGSQIISSVPFVRAIKKVKLFIENLKRNGVGLEYLNIGGGLGIVYDKEKPQSADQFAKSVCRLLKSINLKLILEPGRFIVGNAGILVTKVQYLKNLEHKRFIIVDAAMNDLMRPALYQAYHEILPVEKSQGRHYLGKDQITKLADVVGPICESGDFLGKKRKLNVGQGQYLAVMGTGAYGFSMSSNYNSRPRIAEVMVRGKKACLIREREKYSDLIDNEVIVS
ncbi:MAG: diaminopimelate decarboxylase [Candidatus Omnitrophota bacterium]